MNKCVLILFVGDLSNEALQDFLKKQAAKAHLEGLVQLDESSRIKITAHGAKSMIDQFIDALYDNSVKYSLSDIEIEPFFKHKDFRGVFRIVT